MLEQTPRPAVAATREVALLTLPARHAGKCAVCCHRDRMGIELRFMASGKPAHIAQENGIRNRASIYRHAHAANLFERRRRQVISTYESTLKLFELGLVTVDAVRVAESQIGVDFRQHLGGFPLARQNWIPSVFWRFSGPKISAITAAQLSPSMPKDKPQHRQQESWMSMILKTRKPLNPGDNSFRMEPETLPATTETQNRRAREAISSERNLNRNTCRD
jgi:hypothetical protein